jgi:hypothetical protein
MDDSWWESALAQAEENDAEWDPYANAFAADPMGLAEATSQEPAIPATPAQGRSHSAEAGTPQSRLEESVLPEETPANKKRRLIDKQPPPLVASSASSSWPESPSSGESPLPILFKRPAGSSSSLTRQRALADLAQVSGDAAEPELMDWRSDIQKKEDYETTARLARRLHYKDVAADHCGKSGKERKSIIRSEWTKLSAPLKRGVYERVEAEVSLNADERVRLRRFLMLARCASSCGDSDSLARVVFFRGKQALFTYHDDAWVLTRPAWDFKDSAEPLAAAAQACRDDPFVENLDSLVE